MTRDVAGTAGTRGGDAARSPAPPSVTPSAAPPRAAPPSRSRQRHGGRVTGIVAPFYEDWRDARPIAPVPQGRRPRHRRHPDDARRSSRSTPSARDHLDAYAIADHLVPLLIGDRAWIPELEAEALLAAADLPRREVAGRPAALRPRRPARGRRRQHRQLRRGDVHGAGRHRQRRRPGRRVRGGHRHRRCPPVELRPRGGRRLRRRRRRGAASRRVDRRPWSTPALRSGPRRHAAARSRPSPTRRRGHDDVGVRPRRAARGRRPVRHGRARLPGTGARTPADPSRTKAIEELPVALGMAAGHRRRLPPSRCSARSTTAATPTRSRRWPARSPVRSVASAAVPPSVADDRRRRRAGSTSSTPAAHDGRGRAGDVWADDARAAAAARRGAHRRLLAGRLMRASAGSQPEDLLAHELVAAERRRRRRRRPRERWIAAGGAPSAPRRRGVAATPAAPELRALAARLLDDVDERAVPTGAAPRASPDDLARASDRARARPVSALSSRARRSTGSTAPGSVGPPDACSASRWRRSRRQGIRAIARVDRATGRSTGYFTAVGLTRRSPRRWPWNRRSAHEQPGREHRRDARGRRPQLPADRPRPARAARRGVHHRRRGAGVARAASRRAGVHRRAGGLPQPARRRRARRWPRPRRNPFRDWIGAQIRADVYGWVAPGRPGARRPAGLARRAAHPHRATALYGAMFAAAPASAAVVAGSVSTRCSPPACRSCRRQPLAAAVRFGVDLGRGSLDLESGARRAVRRVRAAALGARAATTPPGRVRAGARRRRLRTGRSRTAVTGGWDTDSNGATVGSICGALAGAAGLPAAWTAPLRNRLTTSVPGFDGIGFDELAGAPGRSPSLRSPATP